MIRYPGLTGVWKRQDGGVAIITVFFLNAMLIALALALDVGRALEARSRMQSSATTAALSGAIVHEAEGTGGAENEAMEYFLANLPSGQNALTYNPNSDVDVVISGGRISVVPANFSMQTFFPASVNVSGANALNVSSVAVAGLPTGQMLPQSIILVTDVSDSMKQNNDAGPCPTSGQNPCNRIQALREASVALLTYISGLPNADQNYSAALVRWSTNVVGFWGYQQGAGHWPNTITMAQNDLMNTYNTTCGRCGMLKATEILPSSPQTKRTLVFLTDGNQNKLPPAPDSFPPDYPPDWPPGAPQQTDSRAAAYRGLAWACHDIKNQFGGNLALWTISFGNHVLNNPSNAAMMNYCASTPAQYQHAANGVALSEIFQQIGESIGSVRLIE